jgi:hypothetical protein
VSFLYKIDNGLTGIGGLALSVMGCMPHRAW